MQYNSHRGPIVVRCPNDMRDQLKEIAGREGETVSTVVRRLIVSAVNRAEREKGFWPVLRLGADVSANLLTQAAAAERAREIARGAPLLRRFTFPR